MASASPMAAGYGSSRRSTKSTGSLASGGEKGRLKLKTCVCAASAQLGREKSRLLQLEQKWGKPSSSERYVQRATRVLEREDAVWRSSGQMFW
eukprot:symbB.v1.2.019813.t1/scaffold1640.1/size107948/2